MIKLYGYYYYHGYADAISDSTDLLTWNPPLRKRQQQAYDRGVKDGEHDRHAILNDKYMLSRLEVS